MSSHALNEEMREVETGWRYQDTGSFPSALNGVIAGDASAGRRAPTGRRPSGTVSAA